MTNLEIKTCAGMGDLILTYSILEQIKHNYSDIRICPDYNLLKQYRAGTIECINFTRDFAKLIFNTYPYNVIDHLDLFYLNPEEISNKFSVKTKFVDLSDKLCGTSNLNIDNYIVINTKVRDFSQRSFHVLKPKLTKILSSTNKKIVLMGERKLGTNLEAKHNNIYTIYDFLKPFCHIDLTEEVLLDYPNINKLRTDLAIMRDAKCVINFGVSGTVILSMATANVVAGLRNTTPSFISNFFVKDTVSKNNNKVITDNTNEFISFLECKCL